MDDKKYRTGSWQDVLEEEQVESYSLHVSSSSQRRLALLFLPHNIPRCVKSRWTVDTILPACSITILSLTDTSHWWPWREQVINSLKHSVCVCVCRALFKHARLRRRAGWETSRRDICASCSLACVFLHRIPPFLSLLAMEAGKIMEDHRPPRHCSQRWGHDTLLLSKCLGLWTVSSGNGF